MKAKIFLAIFLCLVSVSPSFSHVNPDEESKGNKGTITGRIVDESNLPLPGASIYIGKPENGAVSDVNGFYRLVNIEEGQHRLSVSYIGFKPLVRGIDVKAGSTLTIDIQMKAGLDIQEVVINGSLQGQSKALNQQKNSINVTNMISSDQIGRFPDANIGDALKRIPGINVQYDQGEARFGHIRGTAPEYNSVTIDGNRIPSAEPEIRSVQLDLIPSDMVQTIEVNKVVTADMDADAIGGSVNLVTKSNPYKRRIAGTVGGTYNFLSEKPAENISLLYADRFFNDRLGLTLAGTYQNHKLGSDNIEAEWDEGDAGMIMKEFQVRTYLIQRLRQSYSAAIDYTFSPSHKLDAKVMFNHRNDWENRFAAGYNDLDEPGESKVERQLKGGTGKDARLEDQRTLFLSLKGQHHFGLLDVKWNGTYAKASQDRPNERYLQYVYEDVEIDQDLSDTKKPKVIVSNPEARDFNSSWEWDELTEEQGYTEDIDKVFGIDFSLPLSRDHNKSVLKFGGKYRSKEKNQDIEFTDYEPVDEDNFNSQAFAQTVNMTKSNFLAGDYAVGTFFRKEFLGNLDLRNSAQFSGEENPEEEAASFDAREKVLSGYLRYDQKLGDLTLVAGLRTENTDLEYSGYTLSLDEEGDLENIEKTGKEKNSYTDVLPSVLLKYELSRNTQVKAAWSNTIARPRYFDLVPYTLINREDQAISIGNPELDPTYSMNFDLMIEHYFSTVGLLSGGFFYKNIEDFIVPEVKDDYDYLGETWDEFSQPVNAGNADLWGIELAFHRQLDFLPGILKNFGLYTNYTYTRSEVSDFRIAGREDEKMALPGTPENNFNVSLYYDDTKFSARLSFNHAGDFIDEIGGEAFEDRYYDKASHLDFNASYAIHPKFFIFTEINNLLNTPLRYYQGTSRYTMQEEYYNTRLNLGLKFEF